MMYKTKKKLLHFYTHGNITEDFIAARRAKTAKLRKVIRMCFYLHCVLALVCILLSIIMQAGFDIVKISVCALTSVIFAFFAVGDLEHVKTISCAIDLAFAVGAFVTAAFSPHKALYIVCGILMCVLGASMIASSLAAARKRFLDSVLPGAVQRENYTVLNKFSADDDDIPDMPEGYIPEIPGGISELSEFSGLSDISEIREPHAPEEIPEEAPPPPTGKMRELANQVCEIICGSTEKK